MRIHLPELYEAHAKRSDDFLIKLAAQFKFKSIEHARERNWEMAAPRGRRKAKEPTQADNLMAALAFIAVGTRDDEDYQQYIRFNNGHVLAFNGQILAGHPVAEQLTVCPHLGKLKAALAKCGETMILTETPNGQLAVKGDKLRAVVPCIADADFPFVIPDQRIADFPEIMKDAFRVCGTLASEAGEKVYQASLLLEANTCTGTNGPALLQFWHGYNLPPNTVLPKVFTAAIAKQDKKIEGFGFSWSNQSQNKVGSFTIYFEGGAFIRTQCYSDEWPNLDGVFDCNFNTKATPEGFFDGIETVAEFSDDGSVIFLDGRIVSHRTDGMGAQYDVPGLPGGKSFAGKLMKQIAPYAATIDLTSHRSKAFFMGGEGQPIRGAVMGLGVNIEGREEGPAPEFREPAGTIGGAEINGDDGIDEEEPSDEEINSGWGTDA